MEALAAYKQKFIDAMDDDLNTADALSAIFELTREINAYMGAHQDSTKAFLTAAHRAVYGTDRRAQHRAEARGRIR